MSSLLALFLVFFWLLVASLCKHTVKQKHLNTIINTQQWNGNADSKPNQSRTGFCAGRTLGNRSGLWALPFLLRVAVVVLGLRALGTQTACSARRQHGAGWQGRSEDTEHLTERDRERFLWCFLDFLECFLFFEWWCWHSCWSTREGKCYNWSVGHGKKDVSQHPQGIYD